MKSISKSKAPEKFSEKVKYQERKLKKILKFIKNIRKVVTEIWRKEKKMWKIKKSLQQVNQGCCYSCTVCHRSLYQRIIRLFKRDNGRILVTEMYHVVKLLNKKFYTCKTCRKRPYKTEIKCQAVYINMASNPIPDKLNNFKK